MITSERSRILFLMAALKRSPHKARQLLMMAIKEDCSDSYAKCLDDLQKKYLV